MFMRKICGAVEMGVNRAGLQETIPSVRTDIELDEAMSAFITSPIGLNSIVGTKPNEIASSTSLLSLWS